MIETLRQHPIATGINILSLTGAIFINTPGEIAPETPLAPISAHHAPVDAIPAPPTSEAAPSGPAHCVIPSKEVMQKVRALITQKENPHVTRLQETDAQYARKIDPYKRDMAAHYGVTYHSGVKTLADMRRFGDDHTKDKRSFSYFFHVAQTFAAQYGVDIQVMQPDDPGRVDALTPTPARMETADAKTDMASIVEALSDETVEFHRTSGIKHIKLMSAVPTEEKNANGTTKKAEVDGYYINTSPDSVYVNINGDFDAFTVSHEEQHARNAHQCGSEAQTDPPLTAAGHHTYTGVTFEPQRSFDSEYTVKTNLLMGDMNKYAKAGDRAGYCKALAAYQEAGKDVEFVTSYHPEAGEANAEIGGAIADGRIFPMITRDGLKVSPLRKKAEIVLARDYMDDPASIEFIAATSQHAQPMTGC